MLIRHYFLIAFRKLMRDRVYTLINVLGLAIGVACCLLIFLFVRFETSFDKFHPEIDRIYHVLQAFDGDMAQLIPSTGPPMAPAMAAHLPQIASALRLHSRPGLIHREDLGKMATMYQEDQILYADSHFFRFFQFPLVQGNPQTALKGPFQVVLTETTAEKYFPGDASPVGKTLKLDEQHTLTISGIATDPPANSTIQFDFVGSFSTMYALYWTPENTFTSWWYPNVNTYAKLHPAEDIMPPTETELDTFIRAHREAQTNIFPRLQKMESLRLEGLGGQGGSKAYVLTFLVIALVVLLIACVNFMNLTTARSATRSVEVGVRKVVGAQRSMLVRQFMGESLLTAFLSVGLGIGLAELFLPFFNYLADQELAMPWGSGELWVALGALVLLVGLLSGSYPALFLARIIPIRALSAGSTLKRSGSRLRQGLVVFQFAISASLIICTLILWQQHSFMIGKSLGYDQSALVAVMMKDETERSKFPAFKQSLLTLPQVRSVAGSNWAPGDVYAYDIPTELEDEYGEMQFVDSRSILYVGHDFFKTTGVKLKEGRLFSSDISEDANGTFVVNRTLQTHMAQDSVIDRQARIFYSEYGRTIYEKKGKIIGVVEDFHLLSLRNKVIPTFITLVNETEIASTLFSTLIRLQPGNHSHALADIKTTWEELYGQRPFEFRFAESALAEAYEQEARLGGLLGGFASLGMLIACLGILGLAAFAAQQRTQEIGIRKVLGATVESLMVLLNRELTSLVLIALVIALPLGYFLSQWFLEDYPYQAPFSVWPYVWAIIASCLLTWLTVSWQAYRSASQNPVQALRYE